MRSLLLSWSVCIVSFCLIGFFPFAVLGEETGDAGPRFLENGDGTVTGQESGLVWLQNAGCLGPMNWEEANKACAQLAEGACGLEDGSKAGAWRLPTKQELTGLLVQDKPRPHLPEGHPFKEVQPTYYWTTSETSYDANFVRGVHFLIGGGCNVKKTNKHPVWCVREAISKDRLIGFGCDSSIPPDITTPNRMSR